MKKILSAMAVFLISAVHAESCVSSLQGFYAGVNTGVQHSAGKLKGSDNAQVTFITSSSIGKNVFLGGLFAGYQTGVGSCVVIGGEILGNFINYNETIGDATQSSNQVYFKERLQSNFTCGARFRIGYANHLSVLFLGLGVEYNSTVLKSQRVDNQNPPTPQPGNAIIKKTRKGISFAPSVGVDFFVNDKLFVRTEYTYAFPISLNIAHQFNDGANRTQEMRAKFSQSRFTIGLGYKF